MEWFRVTMIVLGVVWVVLAAYIVYLQYRKKG